MAKFNKKYISLKDAAIMSGYTQKELRNFTKIGLVPFQKKGNKIFIRFDAFEKLGEEQAKASTEVKVRNQNQQTNMKSLVPFTTPNRTLVKILEPVAFAAALVLTLQVVALPGIANKIETALEINFETVDYMANTFNELLTVGVSVPLELGYKVATISTLAAAPIAQNTMVPEVAGASTSSFENYGPTVLSTTEEGVIASTLISIADVADNFERSLDKLSQKTLDILVNPFQFSNIDSGMQKFFRL